MGLGWCAVVPALTDLTFRCIPTNDHPNTGHPEGFDHQDDHCTQHYYQGDGIQQQGKGWGVWGRGTRGERAGAGGAREWGAGDMLRAGWGRGEVFFPCLSAPCTDRQANCRSSVSFDTSTYPGDCDHARTTMHSSCFIIQNKGRLGVWRAGLRCFSAPYT